MAHVAVCILHMYDRMHGNAMEQNMGELGPLNKLHVHVRSIFRPYSFTFCAPTLYHLCACIIASQVLCKILFPKTDSDTVSCILIVSASHVCDVMHRMCDTDAR